MPAAQPCTERNLAQIASDWGYGGRVQAAHPRQVQPEHRVVAQGCILTASTSYGLRLCASDLLGTRANVRSATLPRSLTAFLMAEGPALEWSYGAGLQLCHGRAQAAALAVHEAASLTERQHIGQRSRCVVIQATPETLSDEVLAEQVETSLQRTQARPLAKLDRLGALSAEMLAPDVDNAVARLLLESCALELLGRALQSLGNTLPATAASTLHPQDRQRMLRVRDRLLADPGHPHRLMDLARDAGVSISTLKEKFPLVMGSSVFEYLRQLRLDRARVGLHSEGWTVKQAAFFAGYRHPSNFTTAYRRRFGVPPSQH